MTLLNQSLSIPINEFMDIPSYNTFLNIRPVEKGWSSDKKYYIETSDNKSLLLRIADIAEYESKKAEFEHIKQIDVLNIPMSHPIDFGRMWGSSRFMSPEEDSSTLMEHWSLNKDSYKVALKATSKNPSDRYPNIKTFIKEWERAHKQI